MTEPVAYLNKYKDKSTNITRFKPIDNTALVSSNKLYTYEQLPKRVKMTQAEFDELKEIYNYLITFSVPIHEMLDQILENKGEESGRYIELAKRVYQGNDFMAISKKQSELINLFINYSPDNPEETIEVVPDMKWFVRSKERNLEDNYYYFVGKRPTDYWQNYGYRMAAKQFDTKEEAEKWTNPLTEAVQLPVEGE